MTAKILKILQESANRADMIHQLDALVQRERTQLIDRIIAQLDRRDPGYARTVNRLFEIKSEK